MTRQPGRNEPCPCGSGKKYKQCCLRAADGLEQARIAVRRAEGRLVNEASRFALRRLGEQYFAQAFVTFFLGDVPDAEFDEIPEMGTMFQPWFLLDFVGDPDAAESNPDWPDRPDWPSQPAIRQWIDAERPALSPIEQAWLEAASRSPMSPFVVEAVERGRSLDLRDALTGRRFHVLEASASRTLQPASIFFARVVTVGQVAVMLGAAPISLPPDWQLRVIDWREDVFGRRTPSRRDLVTHADDIRALYLDLAEEVFNPAPPQLRNTDGDELEFTTVEYTLSMTAADAYDLIVPLATLEDEVHLHEVDRGPHGEITSATLSWLVSGNAKHQEQDNTILGTLRLSEGRLVAEVNSAARADRLVAEIVERLGAGATLVSRTTEDIAAGLAERAAARARGELDDEPDREPRPPEFEAIEDQMLKQHAMAWLDMEVPALDGLTPRKAARTIAGRERVEALLGSFAQGAIGSRPFGPQLLADMRRELQLDTPAAGDLDLLTLKVTLTGVRPPVWRRLEVPANLTLAQLHRVLQAAMGWTDSHLHMFEQAGITYGDSRRDLDLGCVNEKTTRLFDLLREPKDSMDYEYDFGDGWYHRIVLESSRIVSGWEPPRVLAGKRACPPEDVGGLGGYERFREAMARPDHPEHKALGEWHGRPFDPNAFDLEEAGAAVTRLRLKKPRGRRGSGL